MAIRSLLSGLLSSMLLPAVSSASPNVLFIVVDDLAPTVQPYGGLSITPNIARLARRGVQMQRAYVSVAVCAPSRTAFLCVHLPERCFMHNQFGIFKPAHTDEPVIWCRRTGLRPDTTQVWTIGPYWRQTSRGQGLSTVSLPQLFRMNGYNVRQQRPAFLPRLHLLTASGHAAVYRRWQDLPSWHAVGRHHNQRGRRRYVPSAERHPELYRAPRSARAGQLDRTVLLLRPIHERYSAVAGNARVAMLAAWCRARVNV
eukprot:SAG31_NODE_562_length_14085_cov_164.582869_3_plen_257_part_00